MSLRAIDVLMDGICFCGDSSRLGPGQVVMKMSPEKREILKTLTSDDLLNIRPDAIWGTPEEKVTIKKFFKRKGRWGL